MKNINGMSIDDLQPVNGKRLLVDVTSSSVKATDWAEENADSIERLVAENGALLIRGLNILSSKQFGNVLSTLFGSELINYSFRSTPRTELRGNVYTATEYHSNETIPQHNENSYSNRWPLRIGFLCLMPAAEGGATPISDSREIYKQIDPAVRDRFTENGVMYVRNYSEIDLPWSEVFQTEDRSEVERYCDENNIRYEWYGSDSLRTVQVNQAAVRHPFTDEDVWFNQAHLFHVSNLSDEVRESLLSVVGEQHLPRNTYYGNGDPIEEEVLASIREIYEQAQFSFEWQKNDLMLLDNMLYTHGRQPFNGPRKVLVGMAKPHSLSAT